MTSRNLIVLAGVLCVLAAAFNLLVISQRNDPALAAALKMWLGLLVAWVIVGGLMMRRYREQLTGWLRRLPVGWKIKFIFGATILALIEEAITTTLTNMAPVFGAPIGAAYITASTNYLDVVLFHSVIVFIPMFIVWAWLLSRYDFRPGQVFLLFGILGTIAETLFGGFQAVIFAGFWIFVYGLMVYLPAAALPERPGLRTPSLRHYVLALILPYLATIPLVILINAIHPVRIHF